MKNLFENLKRRIHKKEKTPEEHLKAVFELTKDVELDMKELEKQAREHPDRMIFQDVKNPKEYQLRSNALHFFMIGDYIKAIQYATEGIEINPESAYLFYIRGRSKGYINLFDEGIKDLNQAIKLKPDYADAFVERGYIKQKGGDIKGAEEDLEKRDIKESLDRIENAVKNLKREMWEGKKITLWVVFGSFLTATGLGIISISIRHDPIATVSGGCMFVGGGVILIICSIKVK